MKKLVLKFGGTSVGTIEKIKKVANIVKEKFSEGNEIIVVVSAMAGKTNDLIKQSQLISKKFNKRELDVLLTSGEQATSALMAGALNESGVKSKSWLNWQIPILTEGEHTNARIINISVKKINDYLAEGGVAIIPGFQGISKLGEMTSIGRGGSDATAVAVEKIFNSEVAELRICEQGAGNCNALGEDGGICFFTDGSSRLTNTGSALLIQGIYNTDQGAAYRIDLHSTTSFFEKLRCNAANIIVHFNKTILPFKFINCFFHSGGM